MNDPVISLAEYDQEMTTTRRLLERVPEEKAAWKPHVKSSSLGDLSQLISTMPGWIAQALHNTELDLAAGPGYGGMTSAKLMKDFDDGVSGSRKALAEVTDSALDIEWSLKHGTNLLWKAPRREVVRAHLNHLIHHRGQLSVYLRLLDVKLPSIYGPTADEKWV